MARVVIIGGGMSGLSLAYYLKEFRPDYEVVVLEKETTPGGKAHTKRLHGFTIECGVNGVLDNKPSTLGLARGLGVEILPSNENSKRRFVVKDGALVELPDTPKKFLKSPLLSISGKLRVAYEPFVPKYSGKGDESLASFAKRRLGPEAYKYLIDPMATGIYAGDPERLSLKSCFPRVHELEETYGSLIRAMIQLARQAKRERSGKKVGAGPGGNLVSFKNGMGELVGALEERLKAQGMLRCGIEVLGVECLDRYKFKVICQNGQDIECSHVVLACPAKDASRILRHALSDIAQMCNSFDYPPIGVVAFGIRPKDVSLDLRGFGFLAPGCEHRSILGTLWDSSIFENRAPEGWALLRTLLGGARRRDIKYKSDKELVDITYRELKDLVGLNRAPEFVMVHRWPRAIPQYTLGHEERVEAIQKGLRQYPGLMIRCNWIGGVSLNDCIQNSKELAHAL